MRYLEEAREKAAHLGVKNLETAVKAFKISQGDYPPSLDILAEPLDGKEAAVDESALYDPWKQKYEYEYGNRHHRTGVPLIFSHGPNQGDPSSRISNWDIAAP
jgi:hypothetical protein